MLFIQSMTESSGGGKEHSPTVWEIKANHLTLKDVISSVLQHNARLHRVQVCSSTFQKDELKL